MSEYAGLNFDSDLLLNLANREEACVEVFADRGFAGRSQKLPLRKDGRDAKYSAADLTGPDGIGTDTISSLRFDSTQAVGRVHSVVLYAEDGCRGASKTFTQSSDWVGDDFNDRAKSIAITTWIV